MAELKQPGVAYHSALVPILGTSVDNEAMARAAKLLGPDAVVEAVYVFNIPEQLSLDEGLGEEEREARRVLEVARLQAKTAGCRVRCTLIRTRSPGRAIVEEAKERRSDLIYISTEHAPSEERLLVPTTSDVLANRPCRVVIEHDPTTAGTGPNGDGVVPAGVLRCPEKALDPRLKSSAPAHKHRRVADGPRRDLVGALRREEHPLSEKRLQRAGSNVADGVIYYEQHNRQQSADREHDCQPHVLFSYHWITSSLLPPRWARAAAQICRPDSVPGDDVLLERADRPLVLVLRRDQVPDPEDQRQQDRQRRVVHEARVEPVVPRQARRRVRQVEREHHQDHEEDPEGVDPPVPARRASTGPGLNESPARSRRYTGMM